MKRITPEVKAIADAHMTARIRGQFDNPPVSTTEEVFEKLAQGYTFEGLLREIEVRYTTVTSMMYQTLLNYTTESYKKSVYKGFKALYTKK